MLRLSANSGHLQLAATSPPVALSSLWRLLRRIMFVDYLPRGVWKTGVAGMAVECRILVNAPERQNLFERISMQAPSWVDWFFGTPSFAGNSASNCGGSCYSFPFETVVLTHLCWLSSASGFAWTGLVRGFQVFIFRRSDEFGSIVRFVGIGQNYVILV